MTQKRHFRTKALIRRICVFGTLHQFQTAAQALRRLAEAAQKCTAHPVAIRKTIEELYDCFCRGELAVRRDPHFLQPYHRRELTRSLAQVFDHLVQS